MRWDKSDLEKLAWYMDEAFTIPGTRIRVGWDAIIGLIPGAGETVTFIIQAALVISAVSRHDVPVVIVARMIVNLLIDGVVGSIPLVGDVFDAFFKANTRNIRLLKELETTGKPRSNARHYGFLLAVVLVLGLVFVGIMALVYLFLRLIFGFQTPT